MFLQKVIGDRFGNGVMRLRKDDSSERTDFNWYVECPEYVRRAYEIAWRARRMSIGEPTAKQDTVHHAWARIGMSKTVVSI